VSTLPDLGAIFDDHALTGGARRAAVRAFYSSQFIGHTPADAVLHPIARTLSPERVIDEFIFEFTHDSELPWMLPGIAPTGRSAHIR
jgi:carboxymethylenebutenolidase